MNPIHETNLSGRWDFTPENGQKTHILVPGGGWKKQGFECEAGTYETHITIPEVKNNQVTYLVLDVVNHHAQYFIGEDDNHLSLIHEEVTSMTPQKVNLTPYVRSGKSYLLRIVVRAFQDGRPVAPHCAEWCKSIARGILGGASLLIYPGVHISDTFVKTYVETKQFHCQVSITNATNEDRTIVIKGDFSSWDSTLFLYPQIPQVSVSIKAGTTMQTTIGPLSWELGEESYWWPNVPYKEGYRAKLHYLHLRLHDADGQDSGGAPFCEHTTRFGFRESKQSGKYYLLNGKRINYRGDNLQPANYDRIDNGGRGDAIHTLPGFLPPSDNCPGWPKAVDNFLKLNLNLQREHMVPWTPYMIDVCDEMGMTLIGESATRWEEFDMENGRGFHEVKCLQDIVKRDKNHPSIIRWSLKNEPISDDEDYHNELYNAVKCIDDTRPISEDVVTGHWVTFSTDKAFRTLKDKDDFSWFHHYLSCKENGEMYISYMDYNDGLIQMPDRPYGLGEFGWYRSSTTIGLAWFATGVALARARGASDVRPYVLLSSWASSIPGVRTTDFQTEEGRQPLYGEDNLQDPWSHSGITLLQKACNPMFALDYDFWYLNRKSDVMGHFPVAALQVLADVEVTREITVFNDDFFGEDLELCWHIKEGSLSNSILQEGKIELKIQPGFQSIAPISFKTPVFSTVVHLTLTIRKNNEIRFVDDSTCYEVTGGAEFNKSLHTVQY